MPNPYNKVLTFIFRKYFAFHKMLCAIGLPLFFILLTSSLIYADNTTATLPQDTIGIYVQKQLKLASIAKNKDWKKAITITGNLLENNLVASNDSILNYIKYRHSLYLLMLA